MQRVITVCSPLGLNKLKFQQLGGGEIVPINCATIIVLYRLSPSTPYDPTDLATARSEVGDLSSRVAIDSAWIEACLTAGQIVEHRPFLVSLCHLDAVNTRTSLSDLISDIDSVANGSASRSEDVAEGGKIEESRGDMHDSDLDALVSAPPSPGNRGKRPDQ